MTFCKLLAETTRGKDTVSAYELWDKFSATPRYEITVSRDGIEQYTVSAAKTTWRKRFKEMSNI